MCNTTTTETRIVSSSCSPHSLCVGPRQSVLVLEEGGVLSAFKWTDGGAVNQAPAEANHKSRPVSRPEAALPRPRGPGASHDPLLPLPPSNIMQNTEGHTWKRNLHQYPRDSGSSSGSSYSYPSPYTYLPQSPRDVDLHPRGGALSRQPSGPPPPPPPKPRPQPSRSQLVMVSTIQTTATDPDQMCYVEQYDLLVVTSASRTG